MIVVLLIAAWIAQRNGACQDSHVLAVFAAAGVWSQVAPQLIDDARATSALFWVSAVAATMIVLAVIRKCSTREYMFMSAIGAFLCTYGFWR